jgi:DNA modification methylase
MTGNHLEKPADDTLKNEYLKVVTPLKKPLTSNETRLLNHLQKKFSKKGFFIEINDREIVLYLQTIKFEVFRDYIHTQLADPENDLDPSHLDKEIFLTMLKSISRVKNYGIKAGKRRYVTFKNERKVKDRQSKVDRRGLYYYARDNGFLMENTALPEKYEDVIINDDSESVLKQLPDNCIDLVITSPPYNFGLGYDTSQDGVNWEQYFEKLFLILDECIRVVKFGGRIIINIQPLFSDYIPSHHIISHHFMEKKMIWKGEILWEKNNYNCKYCAWGSWKSPSSPYLKYTWEFLEIFAKGDIKKPGKPENIDIQDDEFKRWVVAKWAIAPEKKMDHYDHPAMFPEELVTRALKLFSFEGDVVLDPFNGAGTTCVAAKKSGRRFLGIDISKKYCDMAEKRVKDIL